MGNEDKIFSEDFDNLSQKQEIKEIKRKTESSREIIKNMVGESKKIDVSDEVTKGLEKGNKKLLGLLGIVVIGAIVAGAYFGITEGLIGKSEPFDVSQCHYGVHSDLFGLRCITEQEYKASLPPDGGVSVSPSDQGNGGEPFKDVSRATDKVEVEKTKDILGYYLITSNGEWDGQYVDFRKLPSSVHLTGTQKISFRCFNDDFLKTSTFFATFRNSIENNLKVQVYINDKLVNEQSTDTNKALIFEGSCIQVIP